MKLTVVYIDGAIERFKKVREALTVNGGLRIIRKSGEPLTLLLNTVKAVKVEK